MNDSALISKLRTRREQIEAQIASAAATAGRLPEEVTLVAVSKTVDRSTVNAAYEAGFRVFGENRVQDATRKFELALPPDAQLLMIGQLQSNKASPAVRLFDRVESVDRLSVVEALDRSATNQGKLIDMLVQVNIAEESQKAGCARSEAASLVRSISERPALHLCGLMTIAPLVNDPEEARPVFRGLRELRDELASCFPNLDLSVLSMGMTNDFQVAIEEGSTEIRVGRAIFE
jgi:pyridoxal phosphate enzyme (YggS family)